jgi:UDP-N-acetylglucosamine--N-acetylmuramyl-(pentapeptide) pyrophosphoryl-undecaprenol N-acetylglucosamine transferase
LALKTIARFCDYITLTVEESKTFFPGKRTKEVTGYPLRPGLDTWTKDEARTFFALQENIPVLLVFGGSKGAHSINLAVVNALPALLEKVQVIHITGKGDWPMIEKVRAGLSSGQSNSYRPYPYLYDEIGAAMSLSDLALTRAGASTLGELPIFGLPAILVPYPYAWNYQRVNASYLIRHGAAVQVEDSQLGTEIVTKVSELIDDKERLTGMSQAMRSLARPDAAEKIATLLRQLASSSKNAGTHHVPNPSGRGV